MELSHDVLIRFLQRGYRVELTPHIAAKGSTVEQLVQAVALLQHKQGCQPETISPNRFVLWLDSHSLYRAWTVLSQAALMWH